MATFSPAPVTGQKRGPGRPLKDATLSKKPKLSTSDSTPKSTSANLQSIEPVLGETDVPRLTSKVTETKPLPTLPRPQAPALSDDEYQSYAASAVLAASFERSRQNWMVAGIFDRVYSRPSKNMPRPNKIDSKNYKPTGQCRIRIEPHMFEVETWVEKQKVQSIPVTTQVPHQGQSGISQAYQPGPSRALQPAFSSTPTAPVASSGVQHGASSSTAVQQPPQRSTAQSAKPLQPASSQDPKPSPDPVISMLATRASSDPQLKTLMKQVATGNATPEQLALFQQNIDELQKAVEEQRKKREEEERQRADLERQQRFQREQAQYYQRPPPTQTKWIPERPAVIFQFIRPPYNEDRYQFPRYSILEVISSQHCLASFIITRKGSEAADPSGLDPDTEYWQPMTLLIECAFQREQPMHNIQKWVKPPDEVKKHMQEIISRCTRAPDTHLALRLPFKSTAVTESEGASKEATPIVDERVKLGKLGSSGTKSVKGVSAVQKRKPAANDSKTMNDEKTGSETAGHEGANQASLTTSAANEVPKGATDVATSGATDEQASTANAVAASAESNARPKRSSRKSVRISDARE
ncbi:hypothetical protein K431DRAFT_289393 [Polychaeton citri CBS 116435]|uniref:SWR1-complex protein 3 domain-containing protein n=1 Tax=Polychaeton citri CBS 116435 TaxID=1314669 RepID=A0A9P4Q1Q3_9PEZI|nr:hypothetical protein K431DRAFT_289393 [Polychaeton citri CBS 116435]